MKRRHAIWHKVKKEAAARDGYRCILCGAPATDVHHVVFRSQGGKDDVNNVVCLCRACHEAAHGIGAKHYRELFKKYLEGKA